MVIFLKVHMIGIKGTGMSALALVLKDLGYDVTGSDIEKEIFTQYELINKGIKIKSFAITNLDDIDLVVAGHNFIQSDNIEINEAKKRNIKILEYNECLQEIIRDYYSIAVCGSNGKSTTTALITSILNGCENTSYLVGSGEGGANKDSRYFVFEACEHQRHFLKYHPNIILINNIDYDHVDYYKSEEEYAKAFYEFKENALDKVIVNGDDNNLKKFKNVITFGINNHDMFNARNVKYNNGIQYDLYYKDDFIRHVDLSVYGEHMVYNTLASISVCMCLGMDIDLILKSIKNFSGVKRRFKETIINDDVYIDDYAHHPSKIKAIINAIKSKYPKRKIFVFYRPDRVSRLNYFSSLFAKELLKADKAYILPFLNMGEEEKESIEKFIKENPRVRISDDKVYKRVAKENGVIYLMVSSKDVSEVKENILKYKGD